MSRNWLTQETTRCKSSRQAAQWGTIAVVSFFWACLLSFGLEYAVLLVFSKRGPFHRHALCVGVAIVASYLVIGAVMAIQLHFELF